MSVIPSINCIMSLHFIIENVIPLEIKKRGPKAVEIYIHALHEGKEKIPYCGLLILGKQKVGKTSLYRQLVKMPFKIDLDSTRGIDNNTVDTVERRPLGIEKGKWQEKDRGSEPNERFTDALANELMGTLPSAASKEDEDEDDVGEGELLAWIQGAVDERVREKEGKIIQAIPLIMQFLATQGAQPVPPATSATADKPSHLPKTAKTPKAGKPHPPKEKPPSKKPGPSPGPRRRERPPPKQDPPPSQKPDTAVPTVRKNDPLPTLEPREGAKINDILRSGAQDRKEPSLLLNTLDFAGQQHYKPMHYCFISRRALYVIVFRVPDMLDFIQKKSEVANPIEEVRYWIHSIHARIYPPDEAVEKEDKKLNRVFLVGTHRGDHSNEDLKKIDVAIKEHLVMCESNHCVNHIHPRSSPQLDLKFFFPVENSIDYQENEENYLEESGTKFFQEEVQMKCEGLPFLNEDHPLKWLKFEERLEQCDITKSCAPITSIERVKEFAERSGIVDEEMQDLALKFLHDTGKIIYLGMLCFNCCPLYSLYVCSVCCR